MKVNYLADLLRFEFPRDQFALFGSAPLVVRGIKEENKDLDLIVTQGLWDDIVKEYNPPTQIALSGNLVLELTPNIEIFKTWPPFDDTDFLIINADYFDGVRYVKLEHVLAWKSSFGREKDIEDIKRIRSYIKTDESFAAGKDNTSSEGAWRGR